jgi:hydrogenase maturation protein HypF
VVADGHPGYRTARWARDRFGPYVTEAQHHHAHIAAVLAEHGRDPTSDVIGVAFDGTGYGTDGTIWGGEIMVANAERFHRRCHLRYVPLPGGDSAIRHPSRVALAHLWAAGVEWTDDLPPVASHADIERNLLRRQFETGVGCVPTSSMGRLFDAVTSLAGVRQQVDFEAEAAIELEGLARSARATALSPLPYAFGIREAGPDESVIADPGPVIRAVASDVLAGEPVSLVALGFHVAVTDLIADLAELCRERTGLERVALGGGVFQNALLLDQARHALTDRGFTVLLPRLLPPNDGGIALGQILVGASA